jgi:hypothetical protein
VSKTYDFTSYLAEARPTPFVLRVSDEEQISIEPPDTETLLLIDEATTARRTIELLCGDQFDQVFNLIRHQHKGVMERLLLDMRKHFNLDPAPPGGGGALPR